MEGPGVDGGGACFDVERENANGGPPSWRLFGRTSGLVPSRVSLHDGASSPPPPLGSLDAVTSLGDTTLRTPRACGL